MADEPREGSRRAGHRVLLAIATGLVAIVALEGFSCAALRVSEGRWLGLADLGAARAGAAEGERGEALTRGPAGRIRRGRVSVLHPYLGFVMHPSLAASRAQLVRAGSHPLSVELGFPHNRESVLQTPDPARAVVGIFGGSVADILTEYGADALRAALAEAPAFRGREIVLLSLAAPGYKQPQALMALNYLLVLGAHFDAVVNLDGVNEIALPESELAPAGVAPFYPRAWNARVAKLSPELLRSLGRVAYLEEVRRERALLFSRAPLRWSLTAGLTWSLLDRRLAARAAAAESVLLEGHPGYDPQARGPRLASNDDVRSRAVAVWQHSSRQMARLCAGLGIPYFHFLQPNQYVPDAKPMGAAERRIAFREDSPMRLPIERGYARLREAGAALAAEGIAFSDSSNVFSDVTEPAYVDDCFHLDALGNRLLGAAIGRAMASAPALATPP